MLNKDADVFNGTIDVVREPRLTMGERFKDVRLLFNQHGKETTEAVAKAVGISKSSLSDIENDNRVPGADIVARLAKHYGVSTDYLLGLVKEKTPNTDARAVIAYTGLSEDNVKTLHDMASSVHTQMLSTQVDGIALIDGNKPFLDCLNDLLESVYGDRDTIMKHYIRLRMKAMKNETVDFWYSVGCTSPLAGLEPMEYSDIKTQIPFDNEQVEYLCIKIAKAIESGFLRKYLATAEDIDRLEKDIEEQMLQNEKLRKQMAEGRDNGID